MAVLENCEPKRVFHYFEEICKIPHGSVEEFLNVLFTERKACRASVYHSSESFSVGFSPGGYLKFISK